MTPKLKHAININPPMTRGRFKLSRVDFTSKLEESSRVLTEVVDIKHCLWVWEVGEVNGEPRVDPVTAAEVWDAA
jgi:hypothetical protein